MDKITNVFFSPLTDSPYVRPFRFNYTQNNKEKVWDLLEVHDSVAILIFNVTRRKLILVKQFRPAVYFNNINLEDRQEEWTQVDTEKYPASLGFTLEVCAGIVDKSLSIDQIACEEVLEECGYRVEPSDLQRILSYRSGVGVQGAMQQLYYCEVTDSMKCSEGGGVDDELIEVVELTIGEAERMVSNPPAGGEPLNSPPSCLFALMWFLHYKADPYRKSFGLLCGGCKQKKDFFPEVVRDNPGLRARCPDPPRIDFRMPTPPPCTTTPGDTVITLIKKRAT